MPRRPTPSRPPLSRRDFLRLLSAAGASALIPRGAWALGPSSKLVFGLLDYGPGSDPRPTALRRLAWEVVKRTSVEAELEAQHLSVDAPELFLRPFLVLAGAGALPPLSPAHAARLRTHLTYGGTLLIDSSEGGPGSPFDQSARAWAAQILPKAPLQNLPRKHVLYKSFYLLDEPSGRARRSPYLEGAELDGRFAIIYSQNDLLGAWARDDLGMWEHEVDPRRRELAFRLGVNLVMYSMCGDYKDDQVHLPFIRKRRRS